MQKTGKKQFSMGLLLRIFLVLIVTVSVVVFLNGAMKYNQSKKEAEALEEILVGLNENIEELEEILGSSEDVQALLKDYRAYEEMIQNGGETGATLEEINAQYAKLQALINSSENKEYIVRVAKDRLGLYFPDEEIYYNDGNG